MPASVERARIELAERLRARRAEIEQSVLSRVYGISDPTEAADSTYAEGLRAAVAAALDYGLAGIESGEKRAPPVPAVLLAQAHLAARNDVSLDTVLRRYFAGYTLLGDVLIEEAQDGRLFGGEELKRLLRAQATLFDRLLAAVGEEHAREAQSRPDTFERRRAERVERLLAGELLDASDLPYDFDRWHLGAILAGAGAAEAIREIAEALDRRLLLVRRGEGSVWVWLGGRSPTDPEDLRLLLRERVGQVCLAAGEPGQGMAGWRLTHRQARAALPIALRGDRAFVRYADVALLASILQDQVLATSLWQIYLAPLASERDGGEISRATLRAYFAADRSVSSAAAALGVNRNTVASRLRAIEARIGRPLGSCSVELVAALRLEELSELPSAPLSLAAC
jgi:PucR C-terminal helix-turn-helix domain/GGDEF-like domain